MPIEHKDLTSVHRFAEPSSIDPGAIGAYKGWLDITTVPYILRVRNSSNTGWVSILSSTGMLSSVYDPSNIASNVYDRNNHIGTQSALTITGSKTSAFISNFSDTVRATILTGLSFTNGNNITANDSVITAFGKLQNQIVDVYTYADEKLDMINPVVSVTTTNYFLTNNDSYTLFNNTGATGSVGFTLNTSSAIIGSTRFKFFVTTAQNLTVTASPSAKLINTDSTLSNELSSFQINAYLEVEYIALNKWLVRINTGGNFTP